MYILKTVEGADRYVDHKPFTNTHIQTKYTRSSCGCEEGVLDN